MKKIIFRADGNTVTGLGHLYRTFALVEMYKDDYDCVLVTRHDSTMTVVPKNYQAEIIPAEISVDEEPNWLKGKYNQADTIVIADGYHFKADWHKAVKQNGFFLVYIDDLTTEHMYANVVVNHSLCVDKNDYSAEDYTRFALGTDYAILRPLFIEAAGKTREIKTIDTAFVCFGGADTLNLTLKATEALLQVISIKSIHVVIGGAYKHTDIFDLQSRDPKVKVYQNLGEAELLEVMKLCNLGIAPSSNILYELCSVKMPLFSGYYVENQKYIYKGGLEKGVFMGGEDLKNYAVADFKAKIEELINENRYQEYIDAQAKMFDSGIRKRFLDLLPQLTYRRAQENDVMLVFNWANDKLSRANSYFTEPIALETHKNWFAKKLQDKNCIIFIAEMNSVPAGMVRYEIANEHTVVGILLDENFRGKGIAVNLLKDTAPLYFKDSLKPVHAYIKHSNSASVRSFERAGYKKLRAEVVQGAESFVYELSNKTI